MTQHFCKYLRLEEKKIIRSLPGEDTGHVIWLLDECECGQEAKTDTWTSSWQQLDPCLGCNYTEKCQNFTEIANQ